MMVRSQYSYSFNIQYTPVGLFRRFNCCCHADDFYLLSPIGIGVGIDVSHA
jgi:hypothetical protein